jgi:hypothetical protein
MNNFLLFCFNKYYPNGGINDFKGAFETILEARESVDAKFDFYQIVDKDNWTIIEYKQKVEPITIYKDYEN